MKCLMLVMVCAMVAVVLGMPNHPNNCKHWCTDVDGAYTCCSKLPKERRCPRDSRPDGNCNQPFAAAAAGGVSGPEPCSGNHDCSSGALCCYDSCLQYRKCTNV